MPDNSYVDKLIQDFRTRRPLRAGSLIITVYGDAIAPHGGTVWLGSLIRLLEPFGLNQRLVRTSVYRLSQEGWLTSTQVGRRSYYSLTQSGRRRFENAYRRIYSVPPQDWNGRWCLIITNLPGVTSEQRDALRRELSWQGFGLLAPGILAHPGLNLEDVLPILRALEVEDRVAIMSARSEAELAGRSVHDLVQACWNLDRLLEDYRRFLERFRPVLYAMQHEQRLDPQACFIVRTLLIHEFRRVLLRDPQLPDELLPAGWAGAAARLLCRNLYRLIQAPAERYLMEALETADGPLPEAAGYYYSRFGGL